MREYYPDRPSAPRTFPEGLEAELGGPKAVRAAVANAGFDAEANVDQAAEFSSLKRGEAKSHATGKSYVPEALQKAVPESVERALPDALHDTSAKE